MKLRWAFCVKHGVEYLYSSDGRYVCAACKDEAESQQTEAK